MSLPEPGEAANVHGVVASGKSAYNRPTMTRVQQIFWMAGAWTVAAPLAAGQVRVDVPRTPPTQLDFEFHDPQRITIRLPGSGVETTYWYMLYTVTNNTGRDVQFFPSFRLVTSTLEVVEGGAKVHPRAYDAIAARHREEHPFFAPAHKIRGTLLQGPENARTSAAVFQTFDPEASSFTVYISGLSEEVRRVPNPGFNPREAASEDNPRAFYFRRTLAIVYDLPGDPTTRSEATPVRRKREWLMR